MEGMQSARDIVQEMEKVGGQYALTKRYRHPSMQAIVRQKASGGLCFDLEKTVEMLTKALTFIEAVAKKEGSLFFVSTRRETADMVQKTAEELSQPYMVNRWVGGTISNFKNVRSRVERMEKLVKEREEGRWTHYTKKEKVLMTRELGKLQGKFSGIASMTERPAALIVFDTKREKIAVSEAIRSKIPVIGFSNANADLRAAQYPVPMNIYSREAVAYLLGLVKEAYTKGKEG